jgi:hypothetical protein
MKQIQLIAIGLISLIAFESCGGSKKKLKTKEEIAQDYLDSLDLEIEAAERLEEYMTNLNWDTLGIESSGLIITDARFVRKEYSRYKDIQIKYKNVSGKKIKAIKFKWYGVDAFGEPADCGGMNKNGFGGGFDDSGLDVGRQKSSEWSVLSSNGDKIVKAWPNEIAFEDGTKWKSTIK